MSVPRPDTPITPIKSEFDKREYETFFLPNELQVLLISDPEIEKGAASMDVNVGHLSDPDELPGLAHFCEHMLFLGTKKYPDENSYHAFLSQHSGRSNAYTALEHTNYHFEVLSEYLEEALDRFAQFFICPLFTESATDREVKAVDSEHAKNLQVDNWRYFQLLKSTSNPYHTFSKFGTGNALTLVERPKEKGINVREQLLNFHRQYYSANKMKLVVYGKQNLSTLREFVLTRFSEIPNYDLPPQEYSFTSPFTPEENANSQNSPEAQLIEQTCMMVHMVPIKRFHSLRLVFPVEPISRFYKKKPSHYSSHLIGHEGPGSLLSLLKEKGWVYELVAGIHIHTSQFDLFKVSLNLTDEGVGHIYDIISITFQYIYVMKKPGIQKWIYEEMRQTEEQEFKFKEKANPFAFVTSLSGNMHKYEPAHILSGSDISTEYDPEIYSQFWSYLIPSNMRVYLITPEFEGNKDLLNEKWYQTQYSIRPIPPENILKWTENTEVDPKLKLPPPNEFIPNDFTIRTSDTQNQYPTLIISDSSCKVWHKLDHSFGLPKVEIFIQLVNGSVYETPRTCVITSLWVRLCNDALNEYTYAASIAGLSYSLSYTVPGAIQLLVRGFNQKASVLVQKVFETIVNLSFTEERFNEIKQKLEKEYENFSKSQPWELCRYMINCALKGRRWTTEEKKAVISQITKKDVENFIPQLTSQFFMESLIHGNMTKEESLELIKTVKETLKYSDLPLSQYPYDRAIKLIPGKEYYLLSTPFDPQNENSAIYTYYQIGPENLEVSVRLEVLAQIFREPFYDSMRTQENLGYIVFSGIRIASLFEGFRVIIQSHIKDPLYLDERIELFLQGFMKYIDDMTDERFKKFIDSMISKKQEKFKRLLEETAFYWDEITNQRYLFDRRTLEIEELKKVGKEEIKALFQKHILDKNRCKLSIGMFGKKFPVPDLKALIQEIEEEHIKEDQEKQKILDSKETKPKTEEEIENEKEREIEREKEKEQLEEMKKMELLQYSNLSEWKITMPLYPGKLSRDDFISPLNRANQ